MHTIDLSKFNVRTDLIIDDFKQYEGLDGIEMMSNKTGDISVDEIMISDKATKICLRKPGSYKTISFKDITDQDNYRKVANIFINTLKKMLQEDEIDSNASALIIGLGNDKSTPDALGPCVIDNILVTRHLFLLGDVEKGFRKVSSFKPNVTGTTGIETKDVIVSLTKSVNPDFLIIIDALASSSIERLNKTIQITNTGINPGSGIGNDRGEITKETLGIPVIAIGVPTIVDAVTIVSDTFNYMLKQFSYKIDNYNNNKLKLVHVLKQDYKDHENNLTDDEKEEILGMIGTLSEDEFKSLIQEVLSPIDYNLMVTPKEVDFIVEKLAMLIGNGINKSLHSSFNPTK